MRNSPRSWPRDDDPLERLEGVRDLVDLAAELRRCARPRGRARGRGRGRPARRRARSARPRRAGRARARPPLDLLDRLEHPRPRAPEDRLEQILLRPEVVVDEPVGDAGLLGDVRDAARVVAGPREDRDRRPQDQPPLLPLRVGRHRARDPSVSRRRRRRGRCCRRVVAGAAPPAAAAGAVVARLGRAVVGWSVVGRLVSVSVARSSCVRRRRRGRRERRRRLEPDDRQRDRARA